MDYITATRKEVLVKCLTKVVLILGSCCSVLAIPDSRAKSINAATQDADVNEAGCFLSSRFKTGAAHSLQRYIRRYVSKLILINQLHSINDVTGALCAPKISTSQNDFG